MKYLPSIRLQDNVSESSPLFIQHERHRKMDYTLRQERNTAYNSTYKKLAVQLLNEASCFVLSLALADSFTYRNRQFLKPAKRRWTTTQSPNTPGNICK